MRLKLETSRKVAAASMAHVCGKSTVDAQTRTQIKNISLKSTKITEKVLSLFRLSDRLHTPTLNRKKKRAAILVHRFPFVIRSFVDNLVENR